MAKPYSLRKCRAIFKEGVMRHKRLIHHLSSTLLSSFEKSLEELGLALRAKDIDNAQLYTYEVEQFLAQHGKKSLFEHGREFVIAIVLALIIAALVRQMWFELYEIPTGSMRPTFRESDRVLVFKDAFCINVPFETAHFYFDPSLVKRGTIVVITGDKLDLPDVDTLYFGIFPGKRRYVKRCVGKDGDTLYFYGGKLYGIDKEGKPLEELLDAHSFKNLEYIPFISFEGKVERVDSSLILRHMNIPMAKVQISPRGTLEGTMIDSTHTFGQTWGIENFAMCRLVEPAELPEEAKQYGYKLPDAKLYLELKHHPALPKGSPAKNPYSILKAAESWIPLYSEQLNTLCNSLYTARFYVRKGYAYRYTPDGPDLRGGSIYLDKLVPDGCYEFYNGQAQEIGFGAISYTLPESHPIYPHRAKMIKTLYNSGFDFFPLQKGIFPQRYAYFRDGTLFTMGKPLLEKGDELLSWFSEKELGRKRFDSNYEPFQDRGPPLKDGAIDVEYIKSYGLPIGQKQYLLLGDNHAMSNDSRFFGAVPQSNLQGSVALIFWPPGDRWGKPPQPSLPFFRLSNIFILAVAATAGAISWWYLQRRTSHKSFERRKRRRLKLVK